MQLLVAQVTMMMGEEAQGQVDGPRDRADHDLDHAGRNAECGMRNAECNDDGISHACRVARTPGLPLITHTRKV